MNRWICGLHRGWAHSRKKGAAFLAAAALLLFFLEEPWVLWGSLLLGALDAYQLALEKGKALPQSLKGSLSCSLRHFLSLLTAILWPFLMPFFGFFFISCGEIGRASCRERV